MNKPLLVVTFPNHWSIKNLVHTGVLGLLQQEFEIEAWCEGSKIPYLKAICADFCHEEIIWKETPNYVESFSSKSWRLLQKSLLFELNSVKTEQIFKRSKRGRRSRLQNLFSGVIGVIARSGLGKTALAFATKKRENGIPNHLVNFSRNPAVVFITNPFDFREDLIAKATEKIGAQVVTMIPSWDNLTNKGVLLGDFKRIFVWNELMKLELLRLYPHFELIEIDAIGVPRFDVHGISPFGEFEREALLSSLSLDPRKATILYSNTATASFPQQPQVIRHLIEACENGIFPDCQVLVRCHPHDDVSIYQTLNRPGVSAVWPTVSDAEAVFGTKSAPPKSDLLVLTAMIQASDVVVNAASTIVLDAACCDKPIISVAYDGDETPQYYDSIRSAYDYNHQKPYLDSKAGDFAKDREELNQMVNRALLFPLDKQKERKAFSKLVTNGDAVNQMVNILKEYARG